MQRRRRFPGAMLVSIASVLVIVGTGVVYLVSKDHAVVPGIAGCEAIRDTGAQSSCVADELQELMSDSSSVETGLQRVQLLASEKPLVNGHCHLAMHPIGERAGAKAAEAGREPPSASADPSSPCRMGYMHGSMLGYIEHTDDLSIASVLPTMCAREEQDELQCTHVLGHAIARRGVKAGAEQQLAKQCVASEIQRNTKHPITPADENECLRGGYMEIAITAKQPPLDAWRTRCTAAPARGREQCFAWLPPLAAYRKLPKTAAAAQCRKLTERSIRRACDTGIARAV